MKKRITINANIAKRAEQLAESRKTTVSTVIEESLRSVPELKPNRRKKSNPSFSEKWAGKLRVRTPKTPDPLLDALKTKYGLTGK